MQRKQRRQRGLPEAEEEGLQYYVGFARNALVEVGSRRQRGLPEAEEEVPFSPPASPPVPCSPCLSQQTIFRGPSSIGRGYGVIYIS